MTTLTKTLHLVKENSSTQTGWFARFLKEAEENYFFLISFVITVGSCLGGITAMYILQGNAPIWQLCVNIYLTMGSNVACIGQVPTKWVVNIAGLSILTNIALLLINVL